MKRYRLDQLLSSLGYCSRSEVKHWLRAGRVAVLGAVARDPAGKVDPDLVRVDGEPLDHPQGIYVLFHKPVGVVSSRSEAGRRIYDFFPERWLRRRPALSSVGRLDKDSSGLLLMTDDGALLHRLSSPRRHVPKAYAVTLAEPVRSDAVALLAAGDLLLEGDERPCLPARLEITDARHVRLTLREGRYHQARRMFAALGNRVTALHRDRIGKLELGNLAPGEYRDLSPEELTLVLSDDEN